MSRWMFRGFLFLLVCSKILVTDEDSSVSTHLEANDRFVKKTDDWMASSTYAGGDLYDFTRGATYTGIDFAAGFMLPFGKMKTAASVGKKILRAEKIAHRSPTLLKTSQITRKIFKSRSNSKGFLTRSTVKSYLSNAQSKNKRQIISDLDSIGLKLKGRSPDGGVLHNSLVRRKCKG